MPLSGKIQSFFEDLDARVEAKLGGGGQPGGYYHRDALPYNTPTGQYNGPVGGPYAQWPGQQQQQHNSNSFGGPGQQWQLPQQQPQQSHHHLGVPQHRPRGNSAPPARDRDNDGIPFDAPPPYEDSAAAGGKPSDKKNPAVPGDHWAPTNPFRNSAASQSSSFPSQASQQQQQQQHHAQFAASPQHQQQQQPQPPSHFPPYGHQQQHQHHQPPPPPPPPPGPGGVQPMFPLTFELWYNTTRKSKRTELHMAGQPPTNPAFVATFSLGWKAKTELHERHAEGPLLISAKSTNTSGTKQGMVFPDGSVIELKTSDLRKYYFKMPTGPGGQEERFMWKKARGGDMREVSPVYMGWKLTRESSGEVLAVFGENVGWKNGVGGGTFAFVGAGRSGVLGAHWQNVAVFSFIKVTHDKFVEYIANPIASAVE